MTAFLPIIKSTDIAKSDIAIPVLSDNLKTSCKEYRGRSVSFLQEENTSIFVIFDRITESQGLEGASGDHFVQSPAKAGSLQ